MLNFSESIALTVKSHRKLAGITQHQLANFAAVGKTAVFDIEHAKSTVQLDTLLKVLHVLNIRLIIDAPLDKKEFNE